MLAHYRTMHPAAPRLPPVLFCVGETRRDIIPTTLMADALPEDERIAVTEVEVYGTGVMGSFERDFAQRLRETGDEGARWVVVFSPTGCEAALRALGVLDLETGRARAGAREGRGKVGTYVATIGPTTRDYLRETFGFEPDVCAECPSPEGVGEAIGRFMAGL
jgi:uroporphyrinogen-III synthase